MKNTVSLDDLLKKAGTIKRNKKPKPLSKNAVKGATDFIRKNNIEKKTSSKVVAQPVAEPVAKYEQSSEQSSSKREAKW